MWRARLLDLVASLPPLQHPQYVQPFKPLLLMEARKADALHMPLKMIDHDRMIIANQGRLREKEKVHPETL